MTKVAADAGIKQLKGPGGGPVELGDAIMVGLGFWHVSANRAFAQTQNMEHMRWLARQSADLGISIPDLLGIHAFTGVADAGTLSATTRRDALHAVQQLRRTDIALIHSGVPGKPARPTQATMAVYEQLQQRGATPRLLVAERMHMDGGRLMYDGVGEIPIPEAVFARGEPAWRLQPLEDLGVHFANRPSTREITLSKSKQKELYLREHLPHPETVAGLSTADGVRVAARELGFPLLLKDSNSTGSKGVSDVIWNEGQLEHTIDAMLGGRKPDILVQRYVEVGSRDQRSVAVRDVHNQMQVRASYDRIGHPSDPRANGGAFGSVFDRIPQNRLNPRDRDTTVRATDAIGGDWIGTDIGDGWLWEANSTAAYPEYDVPLPYSEHTIPYLADWLVWGRRTP